jgi:hypothetical protein
LPLIDVRVQWSTRHQDNAAQHAPMREFLLRTLSSLSDALVSAQWREDWILARQAARDFVQAACEFFVAKNTIATNYEILHDEEDSRRLLFASVCTLDGIPKPTSGASGMWTLSAPPSPIALVNGELQERPALGRGKQIEITTMVGAFVLMSAEQCD